MSDHQHKAIRQFPAIVRDCRSKLESVLGERRFSEFTNEKLYDWIDLKFCKLEDAVSAADPSKLHNNAVEVIAALALLVSRITPDAEITLKADHERAASIRRPNDDRRRRPTIRKNQKP